MSRPTLLPLALLTLALACGDKDDTDGPGPVEGDTDSDADADTDSDSDADADTDADADADADTDTDTAAPVDDDGDGYASVESGGDDCDDGDAKIHPGAIEACNGLDDDCDAGTSEDGVASLADGRSFTVLQDAIAAAASGATVTVCAGTWAESVTIGGSLTLLGFEGASATIVDGSGGVGLRSTVTIQRGDVVLEGLTITGGTGTSNDGNTWGGGIYAGRADSVRLTDCIVEGNAADFGGGLAGPSVYPAAITLTDTVVRGNDAYFAGGGFLIFHGALDGVEVTANSSPYGGGGTVWYWDVTADAATTFHDNQATEIGGGVMIWDEGQLTMTGSTLWSNSAGSTGGAIHIDDGSVACAGCDLGADSTDNSPDDVAVQGRAGITSYTAGGPVDFDCSSSSGACTGL